MPGNRFDFSDIVADEVRRVLAEQQQHRPTGSGGLLDGLTLSDITKFISEASKLIKTIQSHQQVSPAEVLPVAAAPALPAVAAPASQQQQARISPVGIYESVVNAIDKIVPVAGDLKLSEVKQYMLDNKEAVIQIIAESIPS